MGPEPSRTLGQWSSVTLVQVCGTQHHRDVRRKRPEDKSGAGMALDLPPPNLLQEPLVGIFQTIMEVSPVLEHGIANTSFEFPLSPSGVLIHPILKKDAEKVQSPSGNAFPSPVTRQRAGQQTHVKHKTHIPTFKKLHPSRVTPPHPL